MVSATGERLITTDTVAGESPRWSASCFRLTPPRGCAFSSLRRNAVPVEDALRRFFARLFRATITSRKLAAAIFRRWFSCQGTTCLPQAGFSRAVTRSKMNTARRPWASARGAKLRGNITSSSAEVWSLKPVSFSSRSPRFQAHRATMRGPTVFTRLLTRRSAVGSARSLAQSGALRQANPSGKN